MTLYIYIHIYILYIYDVVSDPFFSAMLRLTSDPLIFLFCSTHYYQKYLYGYSNISYHKKLGL